MQYQSDEKVIKEALDKYWNSLKKNEKPNPIEEQYMGLTNGMEANFNFDPYKFIPKLPGSGDHLQT